MITPTIIRKGQMGVSEGLPSLVEPYLARPDKTYPNPDPFTGSARYPADQPQPKEGNGAAAPRTRTAQQTPASSAPVTTPAAPAPRATPTATRLCHRSRFRRRPRLRRSPRHVRRLLPHRHLWPPRRRRRRHR